jgi:hypothetical protein
MVIVAIVTVVTFALAKSGNLIAGFEFTLPPAFYSNLFLIILGFLVFLEN